MNNINNATNPLKQLFNILSVKKDIKIGRVVQNNKNRCNVQLSDKSYINVWGDYAVGSNVYIKDGQILGRIKRESYNNVLID